MRHRLVCSLGLNAGRHMQNQVPDQYYFARIPDRQEPESTKEIYCERAVPEARIFISGVILF